jgi:hypothetical protein
MARIVEVDGLPLLVLNHIGESGGPNILHNSFYERYYLTDFLPPHGPRYERTPQRHSS